MRGKKTYTGINIQYPISRLILSGEKTIETRTYPIPKKYIGVELLILETPGKLGQFETRIVGVIKFGNSFIYKDENTFYKDVSKHFVDKKSPWKWQKGKQKWAWPIIRVKPFNKSIQPPPKRGIKFTTNITI